MKIIMAKTNFSIKSFFIIIAGFIIALSLTFLLFSFFQQGGLADDSVTLNDHWNLSINDTHYSDVSLSDTLFPETNKGDYVTLSCTLPDTGLSHAQLILFSCHSTLNVSINGTSVYRFGEERADKNKMIGYGNHYLELPISYAGKTLSIQMKVTENHSFTSVTAPIIADGYRSHELFISKHIMPFFIGIFLITFGITFLFLSVIMCSLSRKFLPLVQLSLISICIGMWTFCNYHLMQLFTPDLALCAYLEYTSLYVAPIPVMLYFYNYIKSSKKEIFLHLYQLYLVIYTVFLAVCLTCHTIGVAHFPAFLRIFQVFALIMLLLIIVTPFFGFQAKTAESRLLICGLLIFALFASLDLIRFNLEKYTRHFLREGFNGFLAIGAVIFILFLLVSFTVQLTQNVYSQAKQDLLEHQANTDSMTGLANRRFCKKEMELFQSFPKNQVFGILTFDLNNLKQTNDSLGHEYGDKLIITFAALLTQTFSDYGTVGRTGGDEFVVLLPDVKKNDVDALVNTLFAKIADTNCNLHEFTISTSFGYAESSETTDILELYKLADSRMYDYKRRYKGKSLEPELFPGI